MPYNPFDDLLKCCPSEIYSVTSNKCLNSVACVCPAPPCSYVIPTAVDELVVSSDLVWLFWVTFAFFLFETMFLVIVGLNAFAQRFLGNCPCCGRIRRHGTVDAAPVHPPLVVGAQVSQQQQQPQNKRITQLRATPAPPPPPQARAPAAGKMTKDE